MTALQITEKFKTKLYKQIKEIEDNSLVEIVAVIKLQSGTYKDIPYRVGVVVLFLAYTYFMFAPAVFDVYLIYFMTIASFFVGFSIIEFIPSLKRLLTSKKRKNKQVELHARAIFQKAGIRHTSEKIGILIYISLFEKKVTLIADSGAEEALPGEEWKKLETGFQAIFSTQDTLAALLSQLQTSKAIFSEYIPSVEDDVNELPDNINVEL
jgi:putative membrane protein